MSEKTTLLLIGAVLGCLGVAVWKMRSPAVANAAVLAPPSALAKWPLAGASVQNGPHGVRHLGARDADGTEVDLVEFDFKANPKLHLELFDQDSDDRTPFDNSARYWGRNAAYVLSHESDARGQIVATCNGGPFDFDHSRLVDEAGHIAPVVIGGKAHFEDAQSLQSYLWTFSVSGGSSARFEAVLRPSPSELNRFEYAVSGVQCLVKNGQQLHLSEPPTNKKWGRPKAPRGGDAGDLGRLDWTKTSRVSLAWNQDSSKLWMLCVHDPEAESASRVALQLRVRDQADSSTAPVSGGWSARDVQDFWRSQGAWGAVLVASGDFVQLARRQGDGQIEFVPSHVAAQFWKAGRGRSRLVCAPSLRGAPTGGSALFYWMVRESR